MALKPLIKKKKFGFARDVNAGENVGV